MAPSILSYARTDLEAVLCKSLEHEPSMRYRTANELGEDLRRILRRDPVTARKQTALYLTSRLARKHKKAIGVLGALLVGLVGTIVVVSALLGRAVRAEGLLKKSLAAEAEALETSEASARSVEAVNGFLLSLIHLAEPQEGVYEHILVKDLVEEAADHASEYFGDNALTEGMVRQTVGVTMLMTGKDHEADAHLQRALELLRGVLQEDDPRIFQVQLDAARAALDVGRKPEAHELLWDIIDRYEPGALPDDVKRLAFAKGVLAQSLPLGDAEAKLLLDQCIAVHEEVDGPFTRETLGFKAQRADRLAHAGDTSGAEQVLRECVDGAFAEHGDDAMITNYCRISLGRVLNLRGDYRRAEEVLRVAVARYSTLYGEESSLLVVPMALLANALQNQQKSAEAEDLYRRAIELEDAESGGVSRLTAANRLNLAGLLALERQFGEAELLLSESLEQYRALGVQEHELPFLAARNSLASLFLRQGRLEEALEIYLDVVAVMDEQFDPRHVHALRTRVNAGVTLARLQRPREAASQIRTAVEGFLETENPDPAIPALRELAKLYQQLDDTEGLDWVREARERASALRSQVPSDE